MRFRTQGSRAPVVRTRNVKGDCTKPAGSGHSPTGYTDGRGWCQRCGHPTGVRVRRRRDADGEDHLLADGFGQFLDFVGLVHALGVGEVGIPEAASAFSSRASWRILSVVGDNGFLALDVEHFDLPLRCMCAILKPIGRVQNLGVGVWEESPACRGTARAWGQRSTARRPRRQSSGANVLRGDACQTNGEYNRHPESLVRREPKINRRPRLVSSSSAHCGQDARFPRALRTALTESVFRGVLSISAFNSEASLRIIVLSESSWRLRSALAASKLARLSPLHCNSIRSLASGSVVGGRENHGGRVGHLTGNCLASPGETCC